MPARGLIVQALPGAAGYDQKSINTTDFKVKI